MNFNEDVDVYSDSKCKITMPHVSTSSPIVHSSHSPPRPGFPQRILSFGYNVNGKSQRDQYSFNDQHNIAALTTSSTLIPTTIINNSTKSEDFEITKDEMQIKNCEETTNLDDKFNPKTVYEQETSENISIFQVTSPTEEHVPTSTFDYLYEFSETRKVLEEFFKCPDNDKIKELEKFSDFNESDDSLVSSNYLEI